RRRSRPRRRQERERPHRCGLPGVHGAAGCAGSRASALAGLETRVRLADHEDLATATDDLAVAVTGLRRLQGGQDLHDRPRKSGGANKPAILAGPRVRDQVLAGLRCVAGLEWGTSKEPAMTDPAIPVLTIDGPS